MLYMLWLLSTSHISFSVLLLFNVLFLTWVVDRYYIYLVGSQWCSQCVFPTLAWLWLWGSSGPLAACFKVTPQQLNQISGWWEVQKVLLLNKNSVVIGGFHSGILPYDTLTTRVLQWPLWMRCWPMLGKVVAVFNFPHLWIKALTMLHFTSVNLARPQNGVWLPEIFIPTSDKSYLGGCFVHSVCAGVLSTSF